ncbi:MAG: VOC family protein [Bryobacteraceae bacterium]|jgi:PhnB protein
MKLNPHLAFGGQCQEAFEFYEQCLGGKIQTMLTYLDSPMAEQVPLEWRGKILHATLTVGDNVLYGADVLPDQYQPPKGFHLTVGIQDPEEAERIFRELSENGTVQMPLQKTFWAVRFGVLLDRFGVSWEINCEQAR